MNKFHSSAEVFEWLSRFINLEKGLGGKVFSLKRMEFLARLAGNPERFCPVIHVAGSKGKGSTSVFISKILEKAGYTTALYTSPHVCDYRERVTRAGVFFDEEIYISAGNEMLGIEKALSERMKGGRCDPDSPEGEEPTFFEFLTLYFFLTARKAKADLIVAETGLGGRLDATNIVDPALSVINTIELEHTEYLGTTLREIAGEKAGIIKKGRPVAVSCQEEEVLDVFKQRAGENGSALAYLPEKISVEDIKIHREGTSCRFRFLEEGTEYDVELSMTGEVQAKNAALAVLAVKQAFPGIGMPVILAGLKSAALPARFEKIMDSPLFIVDGAHTPTSVKLAFETFTGLYGSSGILLFGCAADKNAGAMALLAVKCFSRVIITRPGTFKASDTERTYSLFSEAGNSRKESGIKTPCIEYIPETEKAVKRARFLAEEYEIPVLSAGSFYLAGEVKRYLS